MNTNSEQAENGSTERKRQSRHQSNNEDSPWNKCKVDQSLSDVPQDLKQAHLAAKYMFSLAGIALEPTAEENFEIVARALNSIQKWLRKAESLVEMFARKMRTSSTGYIPPFSERDRTAHEACLSLARHVERIYQDAIWGMKNGSSAFLESRPFNSQLISKAMRNIRKGLTRFDETGFDKSVLKRMVPELQAETFSAATMTPFNDAVLKITLHAQSSDTETKHGPDDPQSPSLPKNSVRQGRLTNKEKNRRKQLLKVFGAIPARTDPFVRFDAIKKKYPRLLQIKNGERLADAIELGKHIQSLKRLARRDKNK